MAADRGQRRAQLVRDRHQEVALLLLRLGEPRGHLAEALGEVADLAAPRHVGHRDVVLALRDPVGRRREREHRLGDPARQVPGERAGDEQPDAERDEQELEQGEPAVRQLGLLLGDDQRAEVLPLELERLPDRLEGLALARRRELEGDHLLAVDERLPLVADLLAVELAQAGAVPEEDRRADVVEVRAGRLLELGTGEVGRRAPLVDRAERGRLVELRQPLRLPPELGERLRAEVILEELDRDRGRDDARERDARQEERRQAEAQGRHSCPYAAGAGSGSFDGSDLVPHAPHGHDRRRVAELAAELPDVDVDGARVAREGVAPDALEQLVAREDEAAVVEQLPEEVELLRGELDLLLADANLAAPGVDA